MEQQASGNPADKKSKRAKLIFIVLVLVVIAVIYGIQHKRSLDIFHGWQTDLDAALKQAKADNKKIIVFVSHSQLSAVDQDVINQNWTNDNLMKSVRGEGFVLVHLDWDNKPAMEQLKIDKIENVPAVLLLDADGKILKTRTGQVGAVEMAKILGVELAGK